MKIMVQVIKGKFTLLVGEFLGSLIWTLIVIVKGAFESWFIYREQPIDVMKYIIVDLNL